MGVRAAAGSREVPASPIRLPVHFLLFAASAGATTAGLVPFGVISYHLVRENVVPVAGVPVVYAAAMAAAALAELAAGFAYERFHGRVLVTLPPLVAGVPPLAFSNTAATAVAGVLLWGGPPLAFRTPA